jgi:AraC family transcriptional regulator, regulatory protein of adaptative response / methylated-DNA-[protein]-cysteine methyltransferase
MSQYETIEKIIYYLAEHSSENIELSALAKVVELSPTHVQKIFTEWAGVSPKQFQRFLTLSYAKGLLKEKHSTLQTSILSGLSSTGRLHDLFVDIEAMTPGQYGNGGDQLTINYSVHDSDFGWYVVASTDIGICAVLFLSSTMIADQELQARFPKAVFIEAEHELHQPVIGFFSHKPVSKKIKLHLKGTNFQLKVWEALLSIPTGDIASYGDIAKKLNDPNMSRAIGTAIGDNPIAVIIPCHRVIKSTGQISGYRWGVNRKQTILGYEASKRSL